MSSSPMDTCYSNPAASGNARSTPDYFHLLQQAAFLNTVGVTALMSVSSDGDGNTDMASSSTDTCLQVFNEALGLMEQVSECPTLQKVCHTVPSIWNIFQTTDPLRDDRFFVCSQALMFNPLGKVSATTDNNESASTKSISEVDLSFYSAVIIFNMALAYHQKACLQKNRRSTYHQRAFHSQQLSASTVPEDPFWQQSDQDHSMDPVHLQSALQLYEHCHQILSTILSPPGDDTDMLKLVTLNNQAQIHYALQHFDRAQDLLDEIRHLCPILMRCNREKSLQFSQQQQQHQQPVSPSAQEATIASSSSSSSSSSSACPRPSSSSSERSASPPPDQPSAFNSFYNVQTMKEISMNALLVTGPPTAASTA